jgi:hypothetical protein
MKIRRTGIIVISVLILVGIVILLPIYLQERPRPTLMFSFNIVNNENIPNWCNELSSTLQRYDIKATVFITGELAKANPSCVSLFANNTNLDLGSSTYNYSDLASISDYSIALQQVKGGKMMVDNISKLDSKVFRAPYGSTDENIYSLLTNSGILADFSYTNQYNKYEDGQFIKYDLIAYNASSSPSNDLLNSLSSSSKNKPVMVVFNNSVPINQVDSFIANTKSKIGDIDFVNASALTNITLSARIKA